MTKKQKRKAVSQLKALAKFWEKEAGKHSFLNVWFTWAAAHLEADKQ